MFMFVVTIANAAERGRQVFLPVLGRSEREMVEVRGLWVTRFDWTNYASADPDKIDEMMDSIADFYDDEVETMLDGLTSLLEPLLMVFLGVIIGGIVISMFLPIFKIGEAVQGG